MFKRIEAILIAIIGVFAPIQPMLITVFALILIDFTTGVVAAYKRGEKITSSGMRRTISKLVVYEIGLMTGFLVETFLLSGVLPVVKLVAAAIGMVEIKSIFENLDSISGGSVFKTIVQSLGSANEIKDKIKSEE